MKYFIKISLISILLLTSCATFNSPMTGEYTGKTKINVNAGQVNALFIFSHYEQTIGIDAIPKLTRPQNFFNDVFNDALQEISNIEKYNSSTVDATNVNNSEKRESLNKIKKESDYIIEMNIKREKSFVKFFFGIIASSITATIIPIRYKYNYIVDVNVLNNNQDIIKSYSREVLMSKWVQTFMVFLYPFHTEKKKKEIIYMECIHDILKQIETEGILNFDEVEKVRRSIYSSTEIYNLINEKLPDNVLDWDKKNLYEWIGNKDIGMIIHIPGDELNEEIASQIFNMDVRNLDNKTEKEGIIFWVDKTNDYPILVISAKNETVLKSQLNINKELNLLFNGMLHLPRKMPLRFE